MPPDERTTRPARGDSRSTERRRLSRRSLLKLTGVTAVTGLCAGRGAAQSLSLRTLMITHNRPVYYELVVPEYLEADMLGGNFSAEDDDQPEEEDGGIVTVEDGTGPAPRNVSETAFFGDRFIFEGEITDLLLSIDPAGEAYIYLDEANVSRGQAIGATAYGRPRTIMLAANRELSYSLSVRGNIEPDTFGGNFISDDDTVTTNSNGDYTTEDGTGPDPSNASETAYLGDRYLFTGDIERLDIETPSGGSPNYYLDERLVTYSELPR